MNRSLRYFLGLVAVAIALAPGTRVRAEDEIDQSLSAAGKVHYDRYCTPCHGAGGAPGKAVSSSTKQPVDLRTYVERHGGTFPAADWLAVLADARPGGPHAAVWRSIRQGQAGSTRSAGPPPRAVGAIAPPPP